MAKELWQFCEHRDIWVTATHIPGVKNAEVDEESGELDTPPGNLPAVSGGMGALSVEFICI